MTFEEKKIKAFEKSIYSSILDPDAFSALKGSFDLAWKTARQETLREVLPAMKFLLHCVNQTTWIAEGPRDIKNPMFLGTGSVDGDQEVHDKYISAKELLKKLEAEREASDV